MGWVVFFGDGVLIVLFCFVLFCFFLFVFCEQGNYCVIILSFSKRKEREDKVRR